jgi:hypothetical protein
VVDLKKEDLPMTKTTDSTVTEIAGVKKRSLLAAMAIFGFMLVDQNGLAASWNAVYIPEVPQTKEPTWPLATIPGGANGPTTFFGRGIATGTLYAGWPYNGTWYFNPVYSVHKVTAASASDLGSDLPAADNIYYVAHLDDDWHVRLSMWQLFAGWTTLPETIDPPTHPATQVSSETVATLLYGGKLYIFYTSGPGSLTVTTYSYVTGVLNPAYVIDGVNGGSQPTAVVAPDGIRVYYSSGATLREAHSADGKTWTGFDVVDGQGFIGGTGGVNDTVGWLPAAIMFNNQVNVFYTDTEKQMLRIAQRTPNGWNRANVDKIDINSHKAPVIYSYTNGSLMDVFYESNNLLRAAFGTGPHAMNLATLDGVLNVIPGAVSGQMGIYSTAVEVTGKGPSVFYWDASANRVRNAYYQ